MLISTSWMKRRLILFIMIQNEKEIKELMEQKKKIEERIKFLQHRFWKNRRIEVEWDNNRYVDGGEYIICINFHSDRDHRNRRLTISEWKDLKDVIIDLKALDEDIKEIIKRLEEEK